MVNIGNDWDILLKEEFQKQYYLTLREFLKKEYFSSTVYPPMNDIFNALKYTPYAETKVVILGQDPYFNPGQAHGLCFSVKDGVKAPPSLLNIFKELKDEYGMPEPKCGELTGWAKQGVLLLNTTLTVRKHAAMSHKGKGWEEFTGKIIELLARREKPMVFMLWGSHAGQFASQIPSRHLVLKAPHPSPLSAYRGFFGCKLFSKCNEFLVKNGVEPIDWH